jgi:hypothetical protein
MKPRGTFYPVCRRRVSGAIGRRDAIVSFSGGADISSQQSNGALERSNSGRESGRAAWLEGLSIAARWTDRP